MKRRYLHPGRAVDHLGWGACFNLTSTVKIWSLKSLQITPFQISSGGFTLKLQNCFERYKTSPDLPSARR